jgi:hypothetical protein
MVRRAIVVMAVVAVPAAFLATNVADAGAGRPAPPPAPGGPAAGPAAVQADVTRKVRLATAQTTSQRGKGWRAIDAATPPFPGTAPAMSASSPLFRTAVDVCFVVTSLHSARAPPA